MRRYIVALRALSGLSLGGCLIGKPFRANFALLGGSELGRILALDQLDRTAGLLHRLTGALRNAGDLERQLGLELTLAEQAHTVLAAAGEPCGLKRIVIERGLLVELAGVDGLLHRTDVHLGVVAREDVVEAALW